MKPSPTNFSLSCGVHSTDFDKLKFVEPLRAHPQFNAIAPAGLRADLKQQLQRQLHVARLAQTDARSAAAIACVGQQAKAARRKIRDRIGPVDQIEKIENFKAELRFEAFGDLRRFEQRGVYGLEAGHSRVWCSPPGNQRQPVRQKSDLSTARACRQS